RAGATATALPAGAGVTAVTAVTAVTIAEGEVAVGAVAAVTGEPAGPPFAAGPADTLDSVLAKEVPRQTAGP
ncbi:hypothetical protein KN55_08270, partial [Mycobacterium tuberculosis]